MPRTLDDVMTILPKERRQRVETRALELAVRKGLRQAAAQQRETQVVVPLFRCRPAS